MKKKNAVLVATVFLIVLMWSSVGFTALITNYYLQAQYSAKEYNNTTINETLTRGNSSVSVFGDSWVTSIIGNSTSEEAAIRLTLKTDSPTTVKISFDYDLSNIYATAFWVHLYGNQYATGDNLYVNKSSETKNGHFEGIWILGSPAYSQVYLTLYSQVLPNGGTGGTGTISNLQIATVPIPPSVWLLGSGLIGLVGLRRGFKKYLNK